MNNLIMHTLAVNGIISMFILAGCSTISTMIPDDMKYGQLYMLKDVMVDASQQCENESIRIIANNWAKQASGSLEKHITYLDEESSTYIEAKILIKDLAKVRNNPSIDNCQNYQLVAMHAQSLVVALTSTSQKETMVAVR